jgi:hypothetical protein
MECNVRPYVGDNLRTRQTIFDDGQIVYTALSAPIANTLKPKCSRFHERRGGILYLPSCGRA